MELNSWSLRAPVVASFPGYLASSHPFHPDKDLLMCLLQGTRIYVQCNPIHNILAESYHGVADDDAQQYRYIMILAAQ